MYEFEYALLFAGLIYPTHQEWAWKELWNVVIYKNSHNYSRWSVSLMIVHSLQIVLTYGLGVGLVQSKLPQLRLRIP